MLLNQNCIRRVGALGLFTIAAGAAYAGALAPQQKASAPARMSTAQGSHLLAARSAQFIENKGQWNPQARFLAKGSNLDLWFTDHGIRYDQHARAPKGAKRQVVDMSFAGGTAVRTTGRGITKSQSDYYTSSEPVLGVHSYHELLSRNVYPGIDVRSYFDGTKPRYDMIVAPNADPSRIRLAFKGASGLSIQKGELRIATIAGGIVNGKPFAYQNVAGKRVPVAAKWTLDGKDATFALGRYDHTKPLVVDPVVYGSYIGGDGGADEVRAVVADANQSVLLTGSTLTSNFPISTGIYIDGLYSDYVSAQGTDAFIFQLSGDAYDRQYAIFVGGQGLDTGQYLKVDAQNNIWLAGTTTSTPVNLFGTGTNATPNVFVMRLTRGANGPALATSDTFRFGPTTGGGISLTGFDVQSSTPSGSSSPTTFVIGGVVTNPANLIAASASSGYLPVPATDTTPTVRTGFVAKYNYTPTNATNAKFGAATTGTPLAGSHYMVGAGGSPNDLTGVVFDGLGNLIAGGTVFGPGLGSNVDGNIDTNTNSAVFQTTPGVLSNGVVGYNARLLRSADVFVRKYDVSGGLLYSGLLGGSGEDVAGGIALGNAAGLGQGLDTGTVYTGSCVGVDTLGNVYITGVSRSYFFPATTGAYFENFTSGTNVFVTKISADFSTFLYSTGLAVSSGETASSYYSFTRNVGGQPVVRNISIAAISPAGLAVDSLGRAFISHNLRPNGITFPNTAGDPNELTGSSLPSLNIPGNLTNPTAPNVLDIPDALYDSPTGTDFPTSEGALTVVDPTGQSLVYDTYVGGFLDDFVYAPYVDTFGDVWSMGFSDASRRYQFTSSTGTVVAHQDAGNLGGLISANAFKGVPEGGRSLTETSAYGALATAGNATNPPTYNPSVARDGFVTKFRVGLPSVQSVTLNPTTIPGGLGRFSTGTITLNIPAPLGGATVTVSLRDRDDQRLVTSANASLADVVTAGAENTSVPSLNVTIPQGSTTGTFLVYSKPVSTTTTVFVRATFLGSFKQASLAIVPFLNSVTLSSASVIGGNTVQGTINLSGTVPANTSIPITISDPTLGELSPLSTSVTVLANQSSATFTLKTHGVDQSTPITVSATLGTALPASATINILPATLQSLRLNPSVVGGGTTSSLTVILDGEAGPSGVGFTLENNANVTFSTPAGTITTIGQNKTTSDPITVTANFLPTNSTGVTTTITADLTSVTTERLFKKVSADLSIIKATIASVTLNPTSVVAGGSSVGTVTLSSAAPANGVYVYVQLTPASGAAFAAGPNVTVINPQFIRLFIAGNATSGTFTINAKYPGTITPVTVTAGPSLNAASTGLGTTGNVTATLTVQAATFTLTLNPTSVVGGQGTSTGTITLPSAATSTVIIDLTSSNTNAVVPASVTILTGSTSATFTITTKGVSGPTSAKISASVEGGGGTPVSATLTINPITLLSVKATPASVRGGSQIILSVLFNGSTVNSGDEGLTVKFSNSAAVTAITPAPYTVGAGFGSTTPFLIYLRANRVTTTQKVNVTVTYHGSTTSTSFTILR